MISVAFAMGLVATSAFGHATLETKEAQAGSYYKAVIAIGHGCEGEATQKLHVEVPEGMVFVKPMPKAGWTLETIEADYATPVDNHGTPVTKGVKNIVWTGSLDDAHFDEFTFRAKILDSVPADSVLYVKVVQDCANGTSNWDQVPAEGQDENALKSPAPGVKVTMGGHSH
jgi:uncharacterized protein YcnI